MRTNPIIILFICSIHAIAQTVIINEKITSENTAVGYHFLPNANRIVIEKGKFVSDLKQPKIVENIFSYDSDGFFEKLAEYESFASCYFSPTEKSFLAAKKLKNATEVQQFKLVLDDLSSPYFSFDPLQPYFNDQFQFGLLNQKNDANFNFEKDDLFLNITNIDSRKNEKFKIQKPNIDRLKNSEQTAYSNNITYSIRVNSENFGIITKSIAKNYKTMVLYRSIYDFAGNQLNDYKYELTIPEKYLIYSDNGGGNIYLNPKTNETYISDLTINNFVIDPQTQDVFIYGLFGENAKNASNITNQPTGFYVFKFDKEGKQIWNSIQNFTNLRSLSINQNITKIKLEISLRKSDIAVKISTLEQKIPYLFYHLIRNDTGEFQKKNEIKLISNSKKKDSKTEFVSSAFLIDTSQNKFLDKESLFAYSDNYTFKNYIDSLADDKPLFFRSFTGKLGIWLLETDNKTFYKALFFKD